MRDGRRHLVRLREPSQGNDSFVIGELRRTQIFQQLFGHRRLDKTGAHGVAANSVFPVIEGKALHESLQRVFRCAVRGKAAGRLHTGVGADCRKRSAGLDELGNREPREIERPVQVGTEDPIPVTQRDVCSGARDCHAGRRHDRLYAAVFRDELENALLHLVGIGHIGWCYERDSAGRDHLTGDSLRGRDVPPQQRHYGAPLCEAHSDGSTDARGCPTHYRAFALALSR